MKFVWTYGAWQVCDAGNVFHNLKLGVGNFLKKSITIAQMAQATENVFHKVKLGFEEDDKNIPLPMLRWSKFLGIFFIMWN